MARDEPSRNRRINLKVSEAMLLQLKIRAARERTTVQDLIYRLLEKKLTEESELGFPGLAAGAAPPVRDFRAEDT